MFENSVMKKIDIGLIYDTTFITIHPCNRLPLGRTVVLWFLVKNVLGDF